MKGIRHGLKRNGDKHDSCQTKCFCAENYWQKTSKFTLYDKQLWYWCWRHLMSNQVSETNQFKTTYLNTHSRGQEGHVMCTFTIK